MTLTGSAHVISLPTAVAGDLVFFSSTGDVAALIRLAQRLRWPGDKNHVAWLDTQQPDGTWLMGQAEGAGVTIDKLLVLGQNDVVVRLPAVVDRDKALYFWREQVGRKYGFLTDASIFVTLLTPKCVDVMLPDTWICSAVIGEGLRFGGWYHSVPDIYQFAPDPLFSALVE